jgi:predicted alpha/beta superfamily hydrolase
MLEFVIDRLGPFDVPGLQVRRWVRVYVPPNVQPAAPVLYMFDGQNVFHDAPSYAGGWYLHRAVFRFAQQNRPAPVVVGIDHGGEQRISELMPFDTAKVTGRANQLLDWLVSALVPRVVTEYGVASGPERVVLGGSSMGGLAALYGHFRHPNVFGGALSMSPAFWFAGARIFEYVSTRPVRPGSRVYLDAGEAEAGSAPRTRRMADALRARGYDRARLRLVIDKRGNHSEIAWRRRAPAALRFLFD